MSTPLLLLVALLSRGEPFTRNSGATWCSHTLKIAGHARRRCTPRRGVTPFSSFLQPGGLVGSEASGELPGIAESSSARARRATGTKCETDRTDVAVTLATASSLGAMAMPNCWLT